VNCLVIEPRTTVSHARPRCKTINVAIEVEGVDYASAFKRPAG